MTNNCGLGQFIILFVPRLVRPTNLMSRMNGKKTHKKKDCGIFRRQFPAKVKKNGKIAPGGRISYIFSFTRTRFGVFDFTMFYSPHATYSIERKKRDDSLLLLFCSLGTVVVVLLYCSNIHVKHKIFCDKVWAD